MKKTSCKTEDSHYILNLRSPENSFKNVLIFTDTSELSSHSEEWYELVQIRSELS